MELPFSGEAVSSQVSEEDEVALHGALLLQQQDQQLQYLRAVCAGDEQRISRLASLLLQQTNAEMLFGAFEEPEPESLDSEGMGRRIGKFRLMQPIGSGGMGTVFLAEDTELERLVALKIPRADLLSDSRQRNRFLRESRLAAKLQHSGVVSVLEVGTVGAISFIVSELCSEGDLSSWLEKSANPVSPVDAARFIADVCDAVEYMHEHGVLHLDLKPSNILLQQRNPVLVEENVSQTDTGAVQPFENLRPLVSDFGVSKALDVDATKTNTSLVVGTLLYMSPEQLAPTLGSVSQQSDVYSLGIVLAQILRLGIVREGSSYRKILRGLSDETNGASLSGLDQLPRDLQWILLKATSTEPAGRYDSAKFLGLDLRAFAEGEKISAKPESFVFALRYWAFRMTRVKEAWWLCLGCNAVMLVWMGSAALLIFGASFPGTNKAYAVASCVGLVVFNSTPMAVFSILGIMGHRWSILPALLWVFGCNVLVPALVLIGVVNVVPGLYENSPFFKSLNHVLVLGFGLVQSIALGVALVAFKHQKKRELEQARFLGGESH